MATRIESDSMGTMEVPCSVYYGAQTARSLIHFSIGKHKMPLPVIHAFGIIKKAAAEVNWELGKLTEDKKQWITQSANEVAEGLLDTHFPLKIWQTGSGTQTNMNVNEVIANRAIELSGGVMGSKSPIHPNDDVNLSQSSNDTFPTAMHISAAKSLKFHFLPVLKKLRDSLHKKSIDFQNVVKIGRTHLMDAIPLTLGQEFSGYVNQIEQNIERIEMVVPSLYELAIGATAVGTGFNAPKFFAKKMCEKISYYTELPFKPAKNKFSAIATHDSLVAVHSALKGLAVSLIKITTDLSLLGSGPRCGLGELLFPENEPGSSIMPGKVNPTQCEALAMICVHLIGNDQAISIAGSRGNFQLNVFKPMIIHNFLESLSLLTEGLHSFNEYFIKDLKPNYLNIKKHIESSLMLVTALSPVIGYDKAAKTAHKAFHENMTLKEACLALGFLSEEDFDRLVQPEKML
ncbi:MAG: class II fumarate hydratase [Chlamydiales bacterium]